LGEEPIVVESVPGADVNTQGSSPKEEIKKSPDIPEEDDEDVWDSKILPQLEDITKILFYSAWGYVDWQENTLGIYGLDLMIDTDLKMWLIEVNKSPCMAYSTDVTAKLVPLFMEDVAKVVIDKGEDTGKLELLIETPFVKEPQEIRSAEEFTVKGTRLIDKSSHPKNKS
jgi:hypothetical protein